MDGWRRTLKLTVVLLARGTSCCPAGTTLVDTFEADGQAWSACEDLQVPGGGLTLLPAAGEAMHLPRGMALKRVEVSGCEWM